MHNEQMINPETEKNVQPDLLVEAYDLLTKIEAAITPNNRFTQAWFWALRFPRQHATLRELRIAAEKLNRIISRIKEQDSGQTNRASATSSGIRETLERIMVQVLPSVEKRSIALKNVELFGKHYWSIKVHRTRLKELLQLLDADNTDLITKPPPPDDPYLINDMGGFGFFESETGSYTLEKYLPVLSDNILAQMKDTRQSRKNAEALPKRHEYYIVLFKGHLFTKIAVTPDNIQDKITQALSDDTTWNKFHLSQDDYNKAYTGHISPLEWHSNVSDLKNPLIADFSIAIDRTSNTTNTTSVSDRMRALHNSPHNLVAGTPASYRVTIGESGTVSDIAVKHNHMWGDGAPLSQEFIDITQATRNTLSNQPGTSSPTTDVEHPPLRIPSQRGPEKAVRFLETEQLFLTEARVSTDILKKALESYLQLLGPYFDKYQQPTDKLRVLSEEQQQKLLQLARLNLTPNKIISMAIAMALGTNSIQFLEAVGKADPDRLGDIEPIILPFGRSLQKAIKKMKYSNALLDRCGESSDLFNVQSQTVRSGRPGPVAIMDIVSKPRRGWLQAVGLMFDRIKTRSLVGVPFISSLVSNNLSKLTKHSNNNLVFTTALTATHEVTFGINKVNQLNSEGELLTDENKQLLPPTIQITLRTTQELTNKYHAFPVKFNQSMTALLQWIENLPDPLKSL